MSDKYWRGLSYTLFLCVFVLILATFRDYGLTTDEDLQRIYGDKILDWYSSFFVDRSASSYRNLNLYGGFFDVVAQLSARIIPWDVFETRHFVNACFGLLAIVAAYGLGSHLSNPMGGFFSALFLTLTPGVYGHMFNNSKDIPFLSLSLISFYFILRSYDNLPRIPKDLIAKVGISIGLAMGIRIGGIILFGYLAIVMACWVIVQQRLRSSDWQKGIPTTILRLGLSYLAILLIAWIVMLLFWPWAQIKPLTNPFKALSEMAHFKTTIRVFFDGQRISANNLPHSYLPTWFAISLPEFYLASLVGGSFLAFKFARRFEADEIHFKRLIKTVMLILGFCFPIAAAISLRSPVYNGLRHFLFAIPMLSILAGIAVAGLLNSPENKVITLSAAAVVVLAAALTAVDMVRLHPYQYVYFNRAIAGGLKTAAQRYETDYWGLAYKEGAEWVFNNYHPEPQERIPVASCTKPPIHMSIFEKTEEARESFVVVRRGKSQILLASTKCHRRPGGSVVHIVERLGTPLLHVIERDQRK